MGEEDKKLMNDLVEQRIELKKEKDALTSELFELDRRIWMLINIRLKGVDEKENKNG